MQSKARFIPEQVISNGDDYYRDWAGSVLINGQDPEAERRAAFGEANTAHQRNHLVTALVLSPWMPDLPARD